MVPISKDFGVPLTEVAVDFTLTLWMRLVGATASGWLADRIGRKKPLMISTAHFAFSRPISTQKRSDLRSTDEITGRVIAAIGSKTRNPPRAGEETGKNQPLAGQFPYAFEQGNFQDVKGALSDV
jgi:hypothetical protein